MKTCKRFHFEDVEQGDVLVLSSTAASALDRVTVQVSEKWSTQTFGEVVKAADGNTFYLQDYDKIEVAP